MKEVERTNQSKPEKQTDFSDRQYFPGSLGNPFDIFLHKVVELEKVPAIVFAAGLLVLALLSTGFRLPQAGGLWLFFMADWALLAALPRFNRSYGPAKPTVIILAFARALIALLPLPLLPAGIVQWIGTLLVVWGFWIEPHRLTVTNQHLTSPKLPLGTKLRVLHLGDLHIERITARERKLNRLIGEIQPDLILFSGDFINLSYLRDPAAWEAVRSVIKEWKAPLGTFVVTGSPAVDLEDIIPGLLKDMPVQWLRDEKVTIPVAESQIDVIGLTCTHKPFIDGPTLGRILGDRPKNFSILLYHTPDLAPQAASLGLDLQLSGHTHGGQVRLPVYGALFAASLYGKRFESGLRKVEDMTLFVTRGIGMEGHGAPRVRLLCPPEIIVWDIDGA
jgi:uncharacterized protein